MKKNKKTLVPTSSAAEPTVDPDEFGPVMDDVRDMVNCVRGLEEHLSDLMDYADELAVLPLTQRELNEFCGVLDSLVSDIEFVRDNAHACWQAGRSLRVTDHEVEAKRALEQANVLKTQLTGEELKLLKQLL